MVAAELEKARAEELHDEHRRKVWEDIKSGTENFDRYMLTLSAGALGLSLAFIKDTVPLAKAVWIPSLIASWIAFVLCISITLISFQISIRALEEMIPHLDKFYLKGNVDAFNKHLKSFWTKAIDWCTYLQRSFYEIVLGVKHFFRTHIAFSFSLGGAALPSSGVLGADHPQQ